MDGDMIGNDILMKCPDYPSGFHSGSGVAIYSLKARAISKRGKRISSNIDL